MNIVLVLILAFFGQAAIAAPFLTADPYLATAEQPVRFDLFFDTAATPVSSTAVLCNTAAVTAGICAAADGSKILRYDVAGLSKGAHTVTAQACNISIGCSASSSSFAFSTATPGIPSGLRVVP